MSLVTAQGIQARQDMDDQLGILAEKIFAYLDQPRTVSEIIGEFESEWSEEFVREAMWRLIDVERADIADDRRLQRAE